MRAALYVAAAGLGAVIAVLGDEPSWLAAVAAVVVFPLAAAAADRRSRPGRRQRQAPLLPAGLAALAGGLLVALLLRLALAAPGWISDATVTCGSISTGAQRLILFAAAVVFVLAATPVVITLVELSTRLRTGRAEDVAPVPLRFYPLAVAASGLALIAAGYVTNC